MSDKTRNVCYVLLTVVSVIGDFVYKKHLAKLLEQKWTKDYNKEAEKDLDNIENASIGK